jgi:hypothetical protein
VYHSREITHYYTCPRLAPPLDSSPSVLGPPPPPPESPPRYALRDHNTLCPPNRLRSGSMLWLRRLLP